LDYRKHKPVKASLKQVAGNPALHISLIYLIISVVWIVGTGKAAVWLSAQTDIPLDTIEFVKGIAFVFITFVFLYFLIRRSLNKLIIREHKIAKLNRVYDVMSAINAEILRNRDRQKLLDQACTIAVEHGGYSAVCIRLVNKNENTLEIAAMRSDIQDICMVPALNLSDSNTLKQEAAAIVMNEGRKVIINDISDETLSERWRNQFSQHGIRACAGFPLIVNNEVIGAFMFYSQESNTFDDDEVRLLSELAADTSIGLTQIENEQQLLYLTYHDIVTGLPNRNLLLDRLNQTIAGYGYRNSRITAVMAISLENYRKIVDLFGVSVGDGVLYDLGQQLRNMVRSGDTVAKIDAHDFVLLLTDIATISDLTVLTRKLVTNLPQVVKQDGIDVVLHYKTGIVVHPKDGVDAEALLRYAGVALSAARKSPEPYQYYSKSLEEQSINEHAIERELQSAISNNELRLVYQPIVNLKDKSVIGFESLLRWRSSRLGDMPPDVFIPVAEASGLIIRIGFWVFEQALLQLKEWAKNGIENKYIAVNVSSHQLRQHGIAARLIELIEQHDLHATNNRLVMEITESALIESPDVVLPELHALKQAGILIYIDDFGTGYSSLSYLRRFPVDALKIDREFINNLVMNAEATALVKGIIGMAHGIGISVVAEGIESDEQYSLLRALECEMGQGYYFSMPVEAHDVRFDV